jgi:hypothetical protein
MDRYGPSRGNGVITDEVYKLDTLFTMSTYGRYERKSTSAGTLGEDSKGALAGVARLTGLFMPHA